MSKSKTVHVCSGCGAEYPKWQGQCESCGAWNSLSEKTLREAVAPQRASRRVGWSGGAAAARSLGDVRGGAPRHRISTGIGEFDRVLGGGATVGSVTLLAGDPGIGKSTLLLQALADMSRRGKALYVSGEESDEQIADRAGRLGVAADAGNLLILNEVRLEGILDTIEAMRPAVAVIDSIQTMHSEDIQASTGSVPQIKECTLALTRQAKMSGCCVFLVGHVTKEGTLAGPKVLEHAVDTVLNFEGDNQGPWRLVRAAKNRFGASGEIGAFEMTEHGLVSVEQPGGMFLDPDRGAAEGSCLFPMQEGPRPLVIEMQALADEAVGSQPQRRSVGVDPNRMAMLLAVLHRHGGLDAGRMDVFMNAVGGIKVVEPGADLALMVALVSSMAGIRLPAGLGAYGEIGLNGEVRGVQRAQGRLREMAKLGVDTVIMPRRNADKAPPGLRAVAVSSVAEAVAAISQYAAGDRNSGNPRATRRQT